MMRATAPAAIIDPANAPRVSVNDATLPVNANPRSGARFSGERWPPSLAADPGESGASAAVGHDRGEDQTMTGGLEN
jgi:hypothetical protein